MKIVQLPRASSSKLIDKVVLSADVVAGTTVGLLKNVNEDSVACTLNRTATRLCLADGHWGNAAAKTIVGHWLHADSDFPATRDAAIRQTERIENKLFELFGHASMDATHDFTPEAAFIAAELRQRVLHIVSYGDCRLAIVRKNTVLFELATKQTWLGAFSHLGLRERIPVRNALIFEEIQLEANDAILIFSDGVDECVYEKPTISIEHIANSVDVLHDPSRIFDMLMTEVFEYGAEDNASLSIIKVR